MNKGVFFLLNFSYYSHRSGSNAGNNRRELRVSVIVVGTSPIAHLPMEHSLGNVTVGVLVHIFYIELML